MRFLILSFLIGNTIGSIRKGATFEDETTSSGTITSSLDGFTLSYRQWAPESPVAVLYVIHGMAEHGGRYEEFAARVAQEQRITVIAHDQRGHGLTACNGSDCRDLGILQTNKDMLRENAMELMAQDAIDLIVATALPGLPVFILGHSMGSVVARRILTRTEILQIKGMVLSGVPTAPTTLESYVFPYIGAGIKLGRGLGHALVQNMLITGKFDAAVKDKKFVGKNGFISSNKAAVDSYNTDSLCGHLVDVDILVSIGSTLSEWTRKISSKNPQVPLLFISGRQDPVCNFGLTAAADAAAMQLAGHTVTEVYLGSSRHEFLNEVSQVRDEGIRVVIDWINRLIVS